MKVAYQLGHTWQWSGGSRCDNFTCGDTHPGDALEGRAVEGEKGRDPPDGLTTFIYDERMKPLLDKTMHVHFPSDNAFQSFLMKDAVVS